MRIQTTRVAGCLLGPLYSLIFLSTMAGSVYLGWQYFGIWEDRNSMSIGKELGVALVSLVGSIAAGIIVIWPTSKLILFLARLKKHMVELEGAVLSTRKLRIDLSQPHHALLTGGLTPNDKVLSSATLRQGEERFHISLEHMSREEAIACFPDENFISPMAVSTEYGVAGYECLPVRPEHGEFMRALFELLDTHKAQNHRYALHSCFPWEQDPAPETTVIELLKTEQEADARRLATLREGVLTTGPGYELTVHHLILTTRRETPENCVWVVPVGHAWADIKGVTAVMHSTSSTGVRPEDVCAIFGLDGAGKRVTIQVAVLPTDPECDEAAQLEMLIMYMNHRCKVEAEKRVEE
jgi:hypothetical protein